MSCDETCVVVGCLENEVPCVKKICEFSLRERVGTSAKMLVELERVFSFTAREHLSRFKKLSSLIFTYIKADTDYARSQVSQGKPP